MPGLDSFLHKSFQLAWSKPRHEQRDGRCRPVLTSRLAPIYASVVSSPVCEDSCGLRDNACRASSDEQLLLRPLAGDPRFLFEEGGKHEYRLGFKPSQRSGFIGGTSQGGRERESGINHRLEGLLKQTALQLLKIGDANFCERRGRLGNRGEPFRRRACFILCHISHTITSNFQPPGAGAILISVSALHSGPCHLPSLKIEEPTEPWAAVGFSKTNWKIDFRSEPPRRPRTWPDARKRKLRHSRRLGSACS